MSIKEDFGGDGVSLESLTTYSEDGSFLYLCWIELVSYRKQILAEPEKGLINTIVNKTRERFWEVVRTHKTWSWKSHLVEISNVKYLLEGSDLMSFQHRIEYVHILS